MKYTFENIYKRHYLIKPVPVNYPILLKTGNVISIELENDGLVIECESWEAINDIVTVLNSTVE